MKTEDIKSVNKPAFFREKVRRFGDQGKKHSKQTRSNVRGNGIHPVGPRADFKN